MTHNETIETQRDRVKALANILGRELCALLEAGDNDFVAKTIEEMQIGTALVARVIREGGQGHE